MNKEISLDDACRILADVKPEQCFWVNNGPIIRNLQEMADTLSYMKNETFKHHVNEEKNDIANWVKDVLRDEELADEIKRFTSKEKILRKIKNEIKFLEKNIEKERAIGQ
ncbi:MAG: DUF5752 family protein [Nanoarchaeota archaeon]|mgnify:CR=1 FL=1